jgi:hypothetical protein
MSTKVYYSDLVDKMNPNGQMVERAILLTEKGFYRMTPGKYKVLLFSPSFAAFPRSLPHLPSPFMQS